jgi:uncharacterized protein (DUF305 family)
MPKKANFLNSSACIAITASLALVGQGYAQDVPIVQPGAPGDAVRSLSANEAAQIADNRYSEADVTFMQDMIIHHFQAVQMSALVNERTNTEGVREIAERIDATQADEIEFMREWLLERGEDAPDPANDEHAMHNAMGHEGHGGHHGHHHTMIGMATPEQMTALAEAENAAFDEMFLDLMIAHHEGAVVMVRDLLRTRGSAYDPTLYDFVNDVRGEQQAEIRRVSSMLSTLSQDPRTGLAAGFRDAGEAIKNLTLVTAMPKPTGFFDPENPVGLRPELPSDDEDAEPRFGSRFPFLSFSNTDIAFSENLMAVGNYHGFNMYDLDAETPELISSVVCPGGQGDVSIVGDVLIMSVEDTRGRVDCGRQGIDEDVSEDRFRGVRIFDISDPLAPRQVGQVQTCRGSHTHSFVSSNESEIIVYNSGTGRVRSEEELAGCVAGLPGDENTALFSIDVIEIPLADPSQSRIIDSPRVFADDETGRIAGLWAGGDHGEGTQSTRRTDQCHDITVFPTLNLAAGACSGNGIILDISDVRAPKRIDAVLDTGFAYWHSATFNNDGTKVLFTDEWGGGGRPRCRAQDPADWGANAIYNFDGETLDFASYFKIPSAQTEQENCVAHNGSIIPVPGRDIFVQSWYQGGLTVIDFTDASNPKEIAFFDRGPIDANQMLTGGYWSSYWYDGRIYATEIVRGLDVFELAASDYLTENEIAAALLADQGDVFNPQQQFPVSWPTHPVVGKAYVDQLTRDDTLSDEDATALTDALTQAEAHLEAGTTDRALSSQLRRAANDLPSAERGSAAASRIEALKDVVRAVASDVR